MELRIVHDRVMSRIRRTLIVLLSSVLAAIAIVGERNPAGASTATDPAAIQVARDLTYGTAEGTAQKMDVYWPAVRVEGRAAVVLVHGGAWTGGDKRDMEWMSRQLAAHGYVAAAINYRLRSVTPWAAELQDVQAAIRFIRSRSATTGIDPARIGILGDSAGGNLAALAGATGSGSWSADARVKAVVSFSGIYNLNALLVQIAGDPSRSWLGTAVGTYTGCPITSTEGSCVGTRFLVSPIVHLDKTDPPHLLIDSTTEITPLLQGTAMDARLRAVGVSVEHTTYLGTQHGRDLFDEGLAQTLDFLERSL
jgi:acetyl esterase